MLVLSGLGSLFLLFVAVIVFALFGPTYAVFIGLPALALFGLTVIGLIAKVRLAERRRETDAIVEHAELEAHLEELQRIVDERKSRAAAESVMMPATTQQMSPPAGPPGVAESTQAPMPPVRQEHSSPSHAMRAVESLAADVVHSMDTARLLGQFNVSYGEKVSVDLDAYPSRPLNGGPPLVDLLISVVLPRQSLIGMLPEEKSDVAIEMVKHVGAVVVAEYAESPAARGHKANTVIVTGWLMPGGRSGKGPRRCVVSARGPAEEWSSATGSSVDIRWSGGSKVEPFLFDRTSAPSAPSVAPLKMTARPSGQKPAKSSTLG